MAEQPHLHCCLLIRMHQINKISLSLYREKHRFKQQQKFWSLLLYFTAQQHHLEATRETTPVLINIRTGIRGAGGSFLLLLNTIISLHSVSGLHLSRQTHLLVQTPMRHLWLSIMCSSYPQETITHVSPNGSSGELC